MEMHDLTHPNLKVALVHEWFVNYAGAERVVEQMLQAFPEAELFALVDFLEGADRHYLGGRSVNTTFKSKNALDAADQAWSAVSQYISNDIPKLAFTLEKLSDHSLSHFVVSETKKGKNAKYNISQLNLKLDFSFKAS